VKRVTRSARSLPSRHEPVNRIPGRDSSLYLQELRSSTSLGVEVLSGLIYSVPAVTMAVAQMLRSRQVPDSPQTALIPWERRMGLLSAVFVVYAVGALAGGLLRLRSFGFATLVPFLAVSLVVGNMVIRQRRLA
jgi:hypothetical protein